MNLRNRAVNAPTATHFSPMHDEAFHDRREFHFDDFRSFLLLQKLDNYEQTVKNYF